MSPATTDVDRFRDLVRRRIGLEHDDSRLDDLAKVLRTRLDATGAPDLDSYARIAEQRSEQRALIEALTVGETYFFRNADHIRALAEHVLPERMRRAGTARRLRVLSLGCATGDEPYSIAILVREHLGALDGWEVELVGVDANPASLARAAIARYSAWALRATSAELVARWFRADGREYILDPQIRGMVRFVEHNFADGLAPWWGGSAWDVVLCRNVLMYLTPALAASVLHRVGQSLADGGYLFLGHAETLRGRDRGFRLCHTHDTFYYQRSDEPDDTALGLPPELTRASSDAPAMASGVAWIDEIDRASRRIAGLHAAPLAGFTPAAAPAPAPTPAPARATAPASFAPDAALEHVRSLFEQERLDDALAALDALPAATAGRAEALRLRAVLCVNRGRLADAEAASHRLLAGGAAEPGAHYVLALCRESAGDPGAARGHHLAALALDPSFAMSRLHLGMLARRAGDPAAARLELQAALPLIERDDGDRLALFGGGFGRAALLTLCRAELRAVGGAA